jgi:predicted nucleic acid-binding protein
MKLVDTSSWIDYLRNLGTAASTRVEELVITDEAGWCDMTAIELWNGARGPKEKRELAELEKEIALFPVDNDVWQLSRKLARACRDSGVNAPPADIVIAACARNFDLEVEHCDAHFDKILAVAAKL